MNGVNIQWHPGFNIAMNLVLAKNLQIKVTLASQYFNLRNPNV